MRQALQRASAGTAARRRAAPVAALLAALAGSGCAGSGGDWLGLGHGPDAPRQATAVPADPVMAFAAQARPGAEATVTDPATGRAVRVRLVRAYAAASGRECREVALLAAGAPAAGDVAPRRLICRGEGGAWAEARPLLRSGVAAAPGGSAVP
jgi:hypothetical protein